MFTATRKGRHRLCTLSTAVSEHHELPPFAKLASSLKQALDGAVQHLVASHQAAGAHVLRSASDAFQLLFPDGPRQRSHLLASVSSTAAENQAAFLPSKSRPAKPGGSLSSPHTGGSSQQEAADADGDEPDQRILISEVCAYGSRGRGSRYCCTAVG